MESAINTNTPWSEDHILLLVGFIRWFFTNNQYNLTDLPTSFMRTTADKKSYNFIADTFLNIRVDQITNSTYSDLLLTFERNCAGSNRDKQLCIIGVCVGELLSNVMSTTPLLSKTNKQAWKNFFCTNESNTGDMVGVPFSQFVQTVSYTQPRCAIILCAFFQLGRWLWVMLIRQEQGYCPALGVAKLFAPLVIGIIGYKPISPEKSPQRLNDIAVFIASLLENNSIPFSEIIKNVEDQQAGFYPVPAKKHHRHCPLF